MTSPAIQSPVFAPEKPGILISVAICTHNRSAFLEKAIRSVLPQLTPDTELLVIDNASTDDTRQVCARLKNAGGNFIYFLEAKLGLSEARNTAVRMAGKYILFLDDDAMAEPGWLEAYRRFFLNPPSAKIGVAGGAVIPYFDCELPKWIASDHGRLDLGAKPFHRPEGALAGCNVAFYREAVQAAGMFDEHLGYKGSQKIPREESELQDRLIKAGWECWWLPGAGIRHFVAAQRLTIKATVKAAFNGGRAAAIDRLKLATSASRRFTLRLGRLLVAPFQIIVYFMQALLLFVLRRQPKAVESLCRATRAAGWAWQLFKPPGESTHD
jgi:glycosyltransferase involved in cell wall biosynthesis